MVVKKRIFTLIPIFFVILHALSQTALGEEKILTMSTTTSTQASGLLDHLLPEFEKDAAIRVKVIAKGTGAAIRDGMDGNVDLIFVHAKEREEKFVAQGYGTKRYAVMHNDFLILGPQKDPARIKESKNAAQALRKIAASGSKFVSRGDDSGTHTKEQNLWENTGLAMEEKVRIIIKKGKKRKISFVYPGGSKKWYYSIGQGMGKTLTFAAEKEGYTLSDRGTYIKYKFGRKKGIELEIMCAGDPFLNNPYSVIPINPQKHPHVKYDLAQQFAEWMISVKGQTIIQNYRLLGRQLFYPDAVR